jgi:hypothetical protein
VSWLTWKFGLNYDSGDDQQLGAPDAKNPRGTPDNWGGTAVYVKDQLTRWYAPSLRAEYFRDGKGGVTGFVPAGAGAPANTGFTIDNVQSAAADAGKIHLWEVTLENEFKINDNLIFRLEYRHDRASKDVFQEGNDAKGRHGQDTLGAEAIFMF